MSADKRTVTTDALETLGKIITEKEKRDAIHLAVDPAIAGQDLCPGDHIGFLPNGRVGPSDKPVGIVDPFLTDVVKEGERFWLVVYPRQITSLRHVWTHPAFKDIDVEVSTEESLVALEEIKASEEWLKEYTEGADCPGYETLMTALKGILVDGKDSVGYAESDIDDCYSISLYDDYIHIGGQDASGEIPPEFWHHVEKVLGVTIPREKKAKYFSCSC